MGGDGLGSGERPDLPIKLSLLQLRQSSCVTRAEQLCALAIPERLADRITEMLDTNDVTFTVENV